MAALIARRLVLWTLTLLLITAAVYAAVRSLPGTPTWNEDLTARPQASAWLERTHAADPILIGYARWMADLARLDLGISFALEPGRPVTALLADALPYTLTLGFAAFTMTLLVAVPLGALSAWRPDSLGAKGGGAALYALHALPVFWIALGLQQTVGGRMALLPGHGPGPAGHSPLDQGTVAWLAACAPHWILPTAALTLGSLAFIIRFCRSALMDAMGKPYAQAARARGAGDGRVLLRHGLANAAVPLISLMGVMLPGIVSGSVLVENVFGLPGVGRLFFNAAIQRDYPVIMAIAVLTATATLIANLCADLLYRAVDPRMAAGGRAKAAA